MSEDLQHLLEHIQREGVDKARAEAESLLQQAREKAQSITEAARKEAEGLRTEARRDAEAFNARARESIRQAGRDLVLMLEKRITRMLARMLDREVARTLDDDTLTELVVAAVKNRMASDDASGMSVLLPADKAETLRDHLLGTLRDAVNASPVEIVPDDRMDAGFNLRLAEGRVEHDFTAPAIADALANLLRPGLAELLRDEKVEPDKPE